MSSLLWVSRRARPCDVSALGDRNGATDTASETERPEHSGGPRRRENLQRSGREEAGPWVMALPDPKINLPGREILSPQRLAAATAGSSGHRDMRGRACGTRKEAGSRIDPLKAFT